MRLRNLLFIGVGIIAGFAAPALADLTYTQGSGTTIFDFVCFTTKHCSAHVPVNSAGTEIATSGNPVRVDPTGTTTQPVSAAALPLPAGAATSANQTTANTSLASIATNSALPLPAQTGIGNVNIGAVEAYAPIQNTIAVSQTAQIMSATQGGGTGAVGDYLSHCIIQPGTTSPGSFQILNNATVIYNFPGGASSVSNLVSWAVPIGSISAGGGWKITNTTNITGTCFGKFS